MFEIILFNAFSAAEKCQELKLGQGYAVPAWAESTPDGILESQSCDFYTAGTYSKARTYINQESTYSVLWGDLIWEKENYSLQLNSSPGYARKMNLAGIATESSNIHLPVNGTKVADNTFKQTYQILMDECKTRCQLLNARTTRKGPCAYANGYVYSFGDDVVKAWEENLKNIATELKDMYLRYDEDGYGKINEANDLYFHCSFGTSLKGPGSQVIAYQDLYNVFSPKPKLEGNSTWKVRNCVDGDMIASHTSQHVGLAFESPDENDGESSWFNIEEENSSLLFHQGAQKRDLFCGQYEHQMCPADSAINEITNKEFNVMSTPMAYTLKTDSTGNDITRFLTLLRFQRFYIHDLDRGFEQINDVCLNDAKCVGYNFRWVGDDTNSNLDLYEHYDVDFYQLKGHNIENLIKYYRGNFNWHTRARDDPNNMFETNYEADQRVLDIAVNIELDGAYANYGMALKMIPCYKYIEFNQISGDGCNEENIKVQSFEDSIPVGYRIATAQEAADHVEEIENIIKAEPERLWSNFEIAALDNGYMKMKSTPDLDQYEAIYDPDWCHSGLCNLVVLICDTGHDTTDAFPDDQPAYLTDSFVCSMNAIGKKCYGAVKGSEDYQSESFNYEVKEGDRLATAREVWEHLPAYESYFDDTIKEIHLFNGILRKEGPYIELVVQSRENRIVRDDVLFALTTELGY